MMRWSCQRLQGCVPVDARPAPRESASSWSCERRSAIFAAASVNVSQRPVRTSTSDAISSPTRCASSGPPCTAAWNSSNRFASSSVSGSRIANSSSTATVKSLPASYASNAERICSSGVSFCASPIARLRYWGEKPFRHARPAPARDDGLARCPPELRAVLVRQGEQRRELVAQFRNVAVGERRERRAFLRIFGFDPLGDLGETRVLRDERRDAGGCRLGGNHAEGLREDRRHHGDVAEREQRREMAVLERPREERALRRDLLEVGAVVPEADDDRFRVEPRESLEQEVHALVVHQLAEVHDGRARLREELREPRLVVLIRQTLVGITWVRGIATGFVEQARERLCARQRAKLVDVDARGHLYDAVDVTDDILEDFTDMRRPDEHRLRMRERFARPGGKLVVAAH